MCCRTASIDTISKPGIMDMLSMFKNTISVEGSNPISKYFRVGRLIGSAGPEMVWKIYEAKRVDDNKDVSVFLFEKKIADKLHKPGRREKVAEVLRKEVSQLSRLKHPQIVKVIHPLEESNDSIAFVTEPVLGSLANLLGNYERISTNVPPEIKDHSFLEIEIKYGLLQICDALVYLHNAEQMIHGNLCPQSIIITRRGFWKLGGLGFSEKPKKDGKFETYPSVPWSTKHPKMAQADLDFIAPEIQVPPTITTTSGTKSQQHCSNYCDIFSLGQTICAIYNNGKSLIQANHNPATYAKRLDQMTELFSEVAHRMPIQLVDMVEKMINQDVRYRPTTQYFMLIKYFDDPVARCMQCIDAVDSRDLSLKCDFFSKLAPTIQQFPRDVYSRNNLLYTCQELRHKLLYKCVFPLLIEQIEYSDMLVMVLPSLLNIIDHSSTEDYKTIVQPSFKKIFNMSRPVQATVYLLEKLDVLLAKASDEEIKTDILPMVFSTLESNSIQGQEAAINVFSNIKKYLDDQTMRKLVLPKAKGIFLKSTNIRTRLNALACIDRLIDSLEKMMIIEEVLPFLAEINCQDVDIIMSIIAIYRHMLSDKKFGLTVNLLATKVMPALIPHTVAPGLSMEQFGALMEVLREMLDQIDRHRRNKMLSEAPDINALEMRRSSLQQMYYLASRANTIRLPEEYMGRMGKRPSFGSNSSIGSAYSMLSGHSAYSNHSYHSQGNYSPGRTTPRRTSMDMRNSLIGGDSPTQHHNSRQYLLTVNEALKYRPPSTPELQTVRTGSNESLLTPRTYRRHSSFQGLGCEEQAVLEKIVRERRASLVPTNQSCKIGPHILVSEPSVQDFDNFLFPNIRRASTQSMGPVVVPEPGRRDSRGRLIEFANNQRRSSFQGICESAMAFFVGGK